MIKKIVGGIIVVTVVFMGAGALYIFLFPASNPPAPAPKAEVIAYDGRAEVVYNTEYTYNCGGVCSQTVTLESISFSGLQTLAANVTAHFIIVSNNKKKPAWVRASSFTARSVNDLYWPAKVMSKLDSSQGLSTNQYKVDVAFDKLPTLQLDPEAADPLEMLVAAGRAFAIGLVAPGKLGETGSGTPKKGSRASRNDLRIASAVAR